VVERCKLRYLQRWAWIPGWWALANWGAQALAEGNTEEAAKVAAIWAQYGQIFSLFKIIQQVLM